MKISTFHLMPHRELPADFERRYQSVWVTPPWHELATAERVGQYYNWTLDELVYAARAGSDGICTNEHHQNAYGFMPSPNLMGSALAKLTNGIDVAIVQMGSTLPTTNPPIRVAEEYGMLDCISGGRLVAGMPLGTAMDANLAYGITPIEQRERYREAHDLILKAWTSREIFAWNGKYHQLPMVNLWPRPIQQPHPPIWIPGVGSTSTFDFAVDHDYCYCFLSYFGNKVASRSVLDGYWGVVQKKGADMNPYRLGFLQLVAVAETDAQAERDYAPHVEYFYHKLLHIPLEWFGPPGHQDYRSLANGLRNPKVAEQFLTLKDRRYRDFVEDQFVIAGSPATVREQLAEAIKTLRIGNLMILTSIGSMPHELVLKNTRLFFDEVAPAIRDLWDDEWENRWWPARLRQPKPSATVPA
jgi:alkanesulfonate monooxygenase SsuD/methylene tetrahydromethanopterin reductase-like flavin-dependent oxidoreductase (luciferase family)